jgi:HEAT repeat protein
MGLEIDWDEFAVAEEGHLGPGGDNRARRALEVILGEQAIRSAVDCILAVRPGAGLALDVLSLLRPWIAAEYCHEISLSSSDIDKRRRAVGLLQDVGDRRALPWLSGYLDDSDSMVQMCGAAVLDHLLYLDLVEPQEAEGLIKKAQHHDNEAVREQAESIRRYLRNRAKGDNHEGTGEGRDVSS